MFEIDQSDIYSSSISKTLPEIYHVSSYVMVYVLRLNFCIVDVFRLSCLVDSLDYQIGTNWRVLNEFIILLKVFL